MTDVPPVEPTPIAIDRASGALRLAERTITLTGTELRLLSLLIERLGDAVSHQEIRDYVWGENWTGGDEALRVAVNRLRKKFEGNQRRPQILVSVRGIGYRLIGTRQA
jgi:DNA-binding response OmpR family regulator